jgi:hypothetical protein
MEKCTETRIMREKEKKACAAIAMRETEYKI